MDPNPARLAARRGRLLTVALSIGAIMLASVVVAVGLAQVEATDDGVGVTRTCGSVFDSVADRSGWEIWWARDLDEPDPEVRAALVRTTHCPDAINARIAIGTILGAIAFLALVAVVVMRQRRPSRDRDGSGERVVRLGRLTSYAGAALTIAGLVAIVLLVADADSTLFLYTDRLVVGVVGLIVLVPTIALFVIGRALVLLGRTGDRDPGPGGDDAR